jgi:hypothetical protein
MQNCMSFIFSYFVAVVNTIWISVTITCPYVLLETYGIIQYQSRGKDGLRRG